MKLTGKTLADVTADPDAFEASFKKGLAADLDITIADITIGEIKEVARRRGRALLAAGVSVDFSVDNAADTAAAEALSAKVGGGAG